MKSENFTGLGCEVGVLAYADNVFCLEYKMPRVDGFPPGDANRLIVVEQGQKLSFESFLSRDEAGSHIDLIVDGVFRHENITKARSDTGYGKAIKFSEAFVADQNSRLRRRTMVVEALDESNPPGGFSS